MKATLNHLLNYQTLDEPTAYQALLGIGRGEYNASQIASFLTVFALRGITVEELSGFRKAMLDLLLPVDFSEFDAMDVCGTGGMERIRSTSRRFRLLSSQGQDRRWLNRVTTAYHQRWGHRRYWSIWELNLPTTLIISAEKWKRREFVTYMLRSFILP